MHESFATVTGLHWAGVVFYAASTVAVAYGLMFGKQKAERLSRLLAVPGLLFHGAGLLLWWNISSHGPYLDRFEVLSSNAWIMVVAYLLLVRFYPRVSVAGIVAYPAAFLMMAIGLFLRPEIKTLPPTFRSIWLVLHILFYKIAFSAIIIAFAFSLFYLLKDRGKLKGFRALPDLPLLDSYAYRFAGFGFTFWAIGMVAGSIWAFQSWNVFWNWDPVQTWSLVTWAMFGVYLHLRRFFRWSGAQAAWLFTVCFLLTLLSLFFTPYIQSSIHAEYFK